MIPEQNPNGRHSPLPQAAKQPVDRDGDPRLLGAIGDMLHVGSAIVNWSMDRALHAEGRPRLQSMQWTLAGRLVRSLSDGASLTPQRTLRLMTPKGRTELLRAIQASARTHRSFRQTVQLVGSADGIVWLEISCTVDPGADAGCTMTLDVQNVSENRSRAAALRKEIVRGEQMARLADIGIWSVDLESGALTWSDEVFHIHELEPGPMPTVAEAMAFYAPEETGLIQEGIRRLTRDGVQLDLLLPATTSRGAQRWIHAKAEVEVDSDGAPIGLVGSIRDVTEQHEAEARLRASEERYMFALEGARDGLWDWNIATDQVYFSPRWKQIIGYEDHEITNDLLEWSRRIPEGQRDDLVAAFYACVNGETPDYRAEFQMLHKDGSLRWILARGQIMARNHLGEPVRIVGTHTDITEQVELREALIAAKEAAEQAVTAKSDFLATMSHEIRTPLNGILGLTQVLLDSRLEEEQAEYLNVILGSGTALLDILNDILDLSRSEAGKLVLERTPFSPVECARSTISLLKHGAANDKNLRLELRVDDDVPERIVGDPARLRQVLLNLVGNAVKFTEEGFVQISLTTLASEGGGMDLMISVRDTGIGISKKDALRLFEAFTQADSTTTRRFGGTGLGLSISRNFIHLMGGNIGCRPHFRGGSVFWVEVPITLPEAAPVPTEGRSAKISSAVKQADDAPVHALVVEDNPINQIVARRMLEKLGCTVTPAENGELAVAVARDGSFDIIFMDCQMPVMDGYEATRQIREHEVALGLRRVPIVAMTANAMESARDTCREAGMDDYVSKPVLAEVLAAVLDRNTATRTAA